MPKIAIWTFTHKYGADVLRVMLDDEQQIPTVDQMVEFLCVDYEPEEGDYIDYYTSIPIGAAGITPETLQHCPKFPRS